ncbi:MAG: calycin-like domain-containing protein [Prevotella sp.]|nr:calycin-like domain-containing protein [Prevotella sp.]
MRSLDWQQFTATKLIVKFNGTKAYARFEGQIALFGVNRPFEYTFGTDDFESTGGGEPGGGETTEKYTVNFDKGAKSTHSGRFLRSFSLQQTGKEKQTESVSALRAAYEDHTSKVFTVEAGSELTASFNYSGEWMNGYVYIDRDTDGEFSYTEGQWDQAGTDLVAYSFYTTLPNPKVNDGNGYNSTGASVSGDARSNVNPPSFTAPTEPGTYRIRFKIDWNCILPGGSKDILSDGGGVWDATLEVVAAEPIVVSTLPFENVAYTTSYNGQGTANVTFTEMSDGTFPMTFVSESLNVNAENLTKGEDAKGRTTYTGTAKRTDADVTFTVNAVVYGEAAAQQLYMTMDNGTGFVVTVGVDPDYVAPVTYKNTLKVVRGTDTKTYENAEVSVLAKGENKYAVTIPSFSDMDELEGTIGKLTFEATGEEENGTLKLTATSAATTQEGGDGWDDYGFTASMDATVTGETLAGTFTVVCPDDVTNYTYTLYYGVEPPVAPDQVDVVEEGFKATGESWKKEGVAIDWDTQYIAAKLDLSTCKISSGPENVLAVGTDITGWNDGPHYLFYYNKAAKVLQYNYLHSANKSYNRGFTNLSKAYIQLTDEVVTIEISKQGGLKINGESALVKYIDTASNPSNNSTESWTTEDLPTVFSGLWALNTIDFGGCQGNVMSNATYKYVKVVPLGWTEPVTPPSVKEEKTFNEVLYMNDQKVADATVVVKEMSDETVNMSLQFSGYEYTSTELTKGTDEKNRTTYTGKVSKDSQTYNVAGVVYEKDNAERLYMTMTDTGVTFVVGENPDAVTPEVTEVSNKTYTSNLRIFDGEEPVVENAEAQVNIIKYSDESYKVTLKDVTLNENTQDLVFVGTTPEEAPTAEAAEPLTINAKSDEATTTFFGKQVNGTFEITEVSDDEIKMEFAIEGEGVLYEGEFNYEAKTPAAEPFCKENYVADGNGFEWEIPVDWDTQKIVMSIDPSTCTGNCEDVIGLGAVPTAWNNTLHLYRTRADKMLQGYFQVPGVSNNNTDKFAETVPFLVEVSKAQGFVVNDEVKIAASAMSYLFTLPTVKMGTGEGANDKSRATYNYVKVVDKDWTKDPETGINATTVAEGEFEVFSVDGVKLSKLQKGLNIVRSADGKVKKVLVK